MRGRALLADEVGLGKTVEAGIVLSELLRRRLARRVLVLVPPGLVAQWQEELRRKFCLDFVTHD
ncbi:MAG: helicase SNF2, partial [Candidatus Rokuibacteriota bacterium]